MLENAILDEVTSSIVSCLKGKYLSSIKDKLVFNPTANLVSSDDITNLLSKAFSALKKMIIFL